MAFSRAMKYEDWTVGESFDTPRRTVTEADIVNFAGISGDFNSVHMDDVFGKSTAYGGRIAHGALVFSISTGLCYAAGIIEGVNMVFLGAELKWTAPVRANDTIFVRLTPYEKRLTKNPARGIIKAKVQVINQEGAVAMDMDWSWIMDV